jgi:hypothetical protein
MANQDKIVIDTTVGYSLEEQIEPPTIVGIDIHFRAITPSYAEAPTQYIDNSVTPPIITGTLGTLDNTFFAVSEPYGTSGDGLGYLSQEQPGNISGASQLNQEYTEAANGDNYLHYQSSGDYGDVYTDVEGTIGCIENGDSTVHGEHYPFIKALKTPYGLYMTEKAAFNHMYAHYDYYNAGYRASAGLHPHRAIHEDTEILMPLTDDIANFGPYAITGDLDVSKPSPVKFLDGWYGIGIGAVWHGNASGVISLVLELTDGARLTLKLPYDVPETTVDVPFAALGNIAPISTYFMLNLNKGLLNQYEVTYSDSPFYIEYYAGMWGMSAGLQKAFDQNLPPVKSIDLNQLIYEYSKQ